MVQGHILEDSSVTVLMLLANFLSWGFDKVSFYKLWWGKRKDLLLFKSIYTFLVQHEEYNVWRISIGGRHIVKKGNRSQNHAIRTKYVQFKAIDNLLDNDYMMLFLWRAT